MPLYLSQDDAGTSSFSLQDFEPSWSSKMNAAVREAWLESYGPAGLDYARSRLGGGNEPKLSAIDAADAIKKSGVKFGASVADGQYTRTQLDLLLERQREMAAIKDVRERTPWDISSPLRGIGMFGAGIVDPINLATAFVPWTRSLSILNGARAGLVSESLATRSLSRAVIGGADAAISTVALEAPYSFIRNELGDDYGALDSMANIAFGAAFGASVNVGAGAGLEGFRRLTGRTQEFDRFRGLSNDDIQLVQAFDEVKDRLGPRDIQRILETYSPEMRRAAGYNDTAGRAGMPEIAAERIIDKPADPVLFRGVRNQGQFNEMGVLFMTPDRGAAEQYAGTDGQLLGFPEVGGRTLDLTDLPGVARIEDVTARIADQVGEDLIDKVLFNIRTNSDEEMDVYKILRDPEAVATLRDAGINVVRFNQVGESGDYTTVAALNPKEVPASVLISRVAPETREAALRSAVAQSVDGRMVDVDAIVGMDDSVGTATRADVVASAERNFEPEQVALANFDASAAVQARLDAAPKWDGVKDAEAALGEAQTLLADTVKAGDQAFKYSRGQKKDTQSVQVDETKSAVEAAGGKDVVAADVDTLVNDDRIPRITLRDLVGMKLFPTIADRTAAGALFTGIDGSKLNISVPLLGGPLFPLRASNMQAGVVWANRGKGVTSQKAAKLKEGANYMLVVLGDADMHQSNTTVSNAFFGTLEAYVRDRRITKKNAQAITDMVRSAGDADANVADAMARFPGMDNADTLAAYIDGLSFEGRKRLLTVLGNKGAQDLGAPPLSKILDATREPGFAGNRWGDGVLVVEVDQENPMVNLGEGGTLPHPDYPLGIKGRVLGKLDVPLNYELLYKDWLDQARATAMARYAQEYPAKAAESQAAGKKPPVLPEQFQPNTRRAFELAKPVVEVTEELISRIGDLKQSNIDSPLQARLAADLAANKWRSSGAAVNEGGISPQAFIDAIAESPAAATLPQFDAAAVKAGIKAGTLRLYQLADAKIYFALETVGDQVRLTALVNNEQGARGMSPAVIAKAIEEGVTHVEVSAVRSDAFPEGYLVELYRSMGFDVTSERAMPKAQISGKNLNDAVQFWQQTTPGFDLNVSGLPPLVTLEFTNGNRSNAAARYLKDGIAGLLGGRFESDATSIADQLLGAGEQAAGSRGGAKQGGTAGVDATGNRGSNPSGIRAAVESVANLSDNELRNLGLTNDDRSFARALMGVMGGGFKYARKASTDIRLSVKELVDAANSAKSWRDWYDRYQSDLQRVFGVDADLFKKMLSATSQATGVAGNVTLAIKAYRQLLSGQEFTGYLPAVIKNLDRIKNDVALSGQKISEYGKANEGEDGGIAVDRHIAELFFGVKSPTAAQVEAGKVRIRAIAQELGWKPRDVQAALWAYNQIRKGDKPASYETYINAKADEIARIRSEFGRGDQAGNEQSGDIGSAGTDAKRGTGQPGEGVQYSRGATRSEDVDRLTVALAESFGGDTVRLLETGAIQIVGTPADIPGGPHPADVKAATAPDGTVYMVAQNLSMTEARGMVLHEVGVHVGMERMLGADVFQSVLSELDGAIARGESWAKAARTAVPADTPAGLVREEQLAYLVQNSPELPIVQRIIAAVRAWAFRTFEFARERMTLTEADFRAMAMSALHHAAKGEDVGVLSGAYARAQTATAAFKRWFGDSKVVDANGEPLVVYHGSSTENVYSAPGPKGITEFGFVAHFGTLEQASSRAGADGAVYPVYLKISNLKRVQDRPVSARNDNARWERLAQQAIDEGYDGLVYKNKAEGPGDSYVVFNSEQIKSATGNRGTFDPNNPDIRYARDENQISNEQAAIDELSTWAGNSLMADSATGRPIVFYMPAPDGPAAGLQVMPFPENGIEGVLINPYKPEAVEDATSPTSWMNEVRIGELADDAGAVPVVVRGTKTVSEDQLYALRKQYPGKSDASIASAEGILFVELQDVQSSYKIVLNPQSIRAVPESLLARIDTQEGNKFGARSGGTREAFMEGFDTLDIDTVDIAMDDAGAADAGAAQPGFRYSRGETPEPAKPADELKPYDDAVNRAKSYASVLRAAADKLDNDAQATEAMRAALPDISPAEITDLLDQLRRQVKGLRGVARTARDAMASEDVAAGLQADAMRAADMLANNLEMAAVIEKRNAALNMNVRLKATAYVNQFREAGLDFEGFRGLLVGTERKRAGGRISVDAEQKGFRGEWLGGLIADLEKQDLMRQFTSGAFDRDISIALWNIGKNGDNSKLAPEAVKIAEVVHKYQTDARNTRNRFGAWIRDLQGYITRQSHDMLKIRDAGEKAYKEFTLPRLDLERSLRDFDGTADDFLTRVYDDFATGSHMKTIAGEDDIAALGRGSSLARRESVSRVLYFKDGNASFEYNEKFGQGRVAESVLQGLDQAGQSAGLLKVLGTNPEATVRRLFDEYAESLRGDPERRSKFLQKRKELDNLLAQVDGSVNIPGNVAAARISSFIRAWQAMAKLGGALISSITDLANYAAEMRFGQNQNLFTGVLDGIGALTQGRAKGEKQQILSSLGVFHESTLGSVFARFDSPDLLGGKMSAAMQMFFKLNGLTWWTESLRDGYALTHSHYLATNAHQSFDKLPDALRDMLGLYNIDAGKWDVLRIATMQEADGREYMTPDALRTVPRAALENYIVSVGRTVSDASVANLVDDLSSALRTMTIDRMHHAVIEPGARTRAFMLRGTQPGTVPGELLRFIGQFKSFPVALIQSTLGREVYGRGYDTISDYMKNGKGDMVGLAAFIALSTAMGYAAMSIKDLLLGKNPRPVDDPRTWAAAFVQGGGLGIYGDFLFGKYNRMGGTLTGSLAGPVANMVDTVADLWTRIRTGDDVAATAFNAALQNTPFMSLFYVRSALNYLVLYKLQEAMNPGFLRRMEKRAERENGQTYYMPPTAVVR
jgi:hypothetical protein